MNSADRLSSRPRRTGEMEITLQATLQGNARSWQLEEGRHRIGRATSNEIVLTDPDRSISRVHAEIVIEGNRIQITDLGSRNGTWVNDRPAQPSTSVGPGDRIRLGNIELAVHDPAASVPSGISSREMLADAEQVPGTVRLPWEQVRSELQTGSRLDRSLFVVVSDAGQLLVRPQSLEETFESVLDLVERVITTRRIFLLLLDETEQEAHPIVRAARPAEARTGEKLMLSRTLMETVLKNQESLLVTDAQADPRFGDQASIVAMDIRSALVAPLFDNNDIIGLIYADTSDPTVRYDLDHLRIFTMLANMIAVKITNTRLLEDQRAKERMEQEMATAAKIQRGLLPAQLPQEQGYEILAYQTPCFETGGDLYDAEKGTDGSIFLTVGDVSGKGIGAALLMSHVIASMRVLYHEGLGPAVLIDRLHRQILRASEPAHYATLFFGRLDPRAHTLAYVNAGHNPPFLLGPDGRLTTLDATGQPVGLLEGAEFEVASTPLLPGSLLCVFSDGITEACGPEGFYGEERLEECLRSHLGRPLEEVAHAIFDSLREFQGSTPPSDDITLFLVRRKPAQPGA
ncbi:MAG: SpoIIE family protein phosphatase [Candidatus Eisenbacteria bacterium]|nr:SpoIIE family protein phosphatase [Candidatus Latescibacterota bacterium]MBD3302128.1 SpoIIE family protein phosphatase [Candidatus Eisenbacteria bacterium]